jgi:hypothetical protein
LDALGLQSAVPTGEQLVVAPQRSTPEPSGTQGALLQH